MASLPSVFVSHGAPDLVLHDTPARRFLLQLGDRLPRPKAILVISAHWLTSTPAVSSAIAPSTIYDFGGFSPELYQMSYPASGAPALAERVSDLMLEAGLECGLNSQRGLDHGAWAPLLLMYPNADIPVTQISLQPHLGPDYHFKLGKVLKPLRNEGVLILASGAITHNLRAVNLDGLNDSAPEWAIAFDRWMADAIIHRRTEELLHYRRLAPFAKQNHPTEEHLLPLFVAIGAGGTTATQLHSSFTYGALSMAAYQLA